MTLLDERLLRVDVNPATCALYGVGRDELIGRRADSMVLGGRLPDSVPTFEGVVRRGRGTGRATVVRPDGEPILSHETVRTHVRDAMGKVGARTRAQLVAVALADRHLAASA